MTRAVLILREHLYFTIIIHMFSHVNLEDFSEREISIYYIYRYFPLRKILKVHM